MSVCLKTGGRVLLVEYGTVFAADIHYVESADVYVIRLNPNSGGYWNKSDATHKVNIGDGYFSNDKVTLVVGSPNIEYIKEGE